jgi:hypothetical protein
LWGRGWNNPPPHSSANWKIATSVGKTDWLKITTEETKIDFLNNWIQTEYHGRNPERLNISQIYSFFITLNFANRKYKIIYVVTWPHRHTIYEHLPDYRFIDPRQCVLYVTKYRRRFLLTKRAQIPTNEIGKHLNIQF